MLVILACCVMGFDLFQHIDLYGSKYIVYAIAFFLMTYIYSSSYDIADKKEFKDYSLYFKAFCYAALVGYFAYSTLGEVTISDEYLFGYRETEQIYIPTNLERREAFYKFFVAVFIPSVAGISQGLAYKKKCI